LFAPELFFFFLLSPMPGSKRFVLGEWNHDGHRPTFPFQDDRLLV